MLSSFVSVQVFPRGQEHRLRLRSTAFRTWLRTKTEIERKRKREREFGDRAQFDRGNLLQCPQLASFTALSSGIVRDKEGEWRAIQEEVSVLRS